MVKYLGITTDNKVIWSYPEILDATYIMYTSEEMSNANANFEIILDFPCLKVLINESAKKKIVRENWLLNKTSANDYSPIIFTNYFWFSFKFNSYNTRWSKYYISPNKNITVEGSYLYLYIKNQFKGILFYHSNKNKIKNILRNYFLKLPQSNIFFQTHILWFNKFIFY